MKARNEFNSFRDYKEYVRVYCSIKFMEAAILVDGNADNDELIDECTKFGEDFVNKIFNETSNNNRSNSNRSSNSSNNSNQDRPL